MSFWGDKNVLKLDNGDDVHHGCINHHWRAHFKMVSFTLCVFYHNKTKGAGTLNNNLAIPQRFITTQIFHSSVHMQEIGTYVRIKLAQECSQLQYSQWSRNSKNTKVDRLMSRYMKCGISIEGNIIKQ